MLNEKSIKNKNFWCYAHLRKLRNFGDMNFWTSCQLLRRLVLSASLYCLLHSHVYSRGPTKHFRIICDRFQFLSKLCLRNLCIMAKFNPILICRRLTREFRSFKPEFRKFTSMELQIYKDIRRKFKSLQNSSYSSYSLHFRIYLLQKHSSLL